MNWSDILMVPMLATSSLYVHVECILYAVGPLYISSMHISPLLTYSYSATKQTFSVLTALHR